MTGGPGGPEPHPDPGTGPRPGETVRDTARAAVGVVMGRLGPYVQLRPLGGGLEWDADPDRVEPISHAEVLSARVAEVNARSRKSVG